MKGELTLEDAESWSKYWKESCKGHDEVCEKFRKAVECPHRYDENEKECRFFDLYEEVEGRTFQNPGSIVRVTPVAERCKYQLKGNRESDFAPKGLEKECKNEDDISALCHFENYVFFNR